MTFRAICRDTTAIVLLAPLAAWPQAPDPSADPANDPAVSLPDQPPEKHFLNWQDNSLSILPYGWNYKVDPSEQSTLTYEHVHDSVIGDLFVFVDLTAFHKTDGDNSTWYTEISPRFSLGKMTKRDLSFTLFEHSLFDVKDVLVAATYERGEEQDEAEAALIGVGFDLDVRNAGLLGPLGKFQFIQLNLYARNNLAAGADHGFRDMQITMAAAWPYTHGRYRFLIDGYFDWALGLGSQEWTYHLNPQLKLDIGNFRGKPGKFYAGLELDLWWNKYQIPDSASFPTDQAACSLLVKYHF